MPQAHKKKLSFSDAPQKHPSLQLTQLEKAFARLEDPQHTGNHNGTLSTQFLSRFGLRSAQDVLTYLKSPGGKIFNGLMTEQILDLEAIEESAHLKQHKKRLQHRRFIISLLLDIMYEREAHTQKVNREIQEDIDQKLHDPKKKIKQTSTETIEAQIQLCNECTEALTHHLAASQKDCETLTLQLEGLSKEWLEIEARYALYNRHLNDINQEGHAELFQAKINDVTHEMSSYTQILSALLHDGKETEAYETLQLTHTLQLKAEMLNRLKIAHQEERLLFNRLGQRVTTYSEADFMVPKDKTLVFQNNQYYLHPQPRKTTEFSPEEKNDAQKTYELHKNDIMSIKMQLQLRRTQEENILNEKKASMTSKIDMLTQQAQILKAMIEKIQLTRANLQPNVKQEKTHSPSPKPVPTMTQPDSTPGHRHKLTLERRIELKKLIDTHPTVLAKQMINESQSLQTARRTLNTAPTPTPFKKHTPYG